MPSDGNEIDRAKKFVVDGILPRGLIHLVAAPVGTGKTTFFMQQIHSMQNGLTFLGRDTFKARIVYITADRGLMETNNTIARLGLVGIELKVVSLKDTGGTTIPFLEQILKDNCKKGDLVFVEPLNFFVRDGNNKTGDINNFGHVSHFLLKVGRVVEELDITVEGSLHSSKAKQGSEYMVAREKVLGSVAWTAFTATTIVIEPVDPKTVDDPGRTIHVMPRDMRPYTLDYTVEPEHGLLVPAGQRPVFKSPLDIALEEHPVEEFTSQDLEDWCMKADLRKTTAYKWLDQMLRDGKVRKVKNGLYKKQKPS